MTIKHAFVNNWTAQGPARPRYLRGGASTESDDRTIPRLVAISNSTADATDIPLRARTAGVRVASKKEALRQRYARMRSQKWFRDAYEGKSLGEAVEVED